jgi:threonine dehydrogenase-like Zn-dependent dehydrogenase
VRAVVFHGVGDIRLDDVEEPKIQEPTDVIIRLTSSAICGTDLHMVRGTLAGMQPGTILGHEGVGVIEELGSNARNLNVGDRALSARPSAAATACTAERASTPSATTPTPTAPGGNGLL